MANWKIRGYEKQPQITFASLRDDTVFGEANACPIRHCGRVVAYSETAPHPEIATFWERLPHSEPRAGLPPLPPPICRW